MKRIIRTTVSLLLSVCMLLSFVGVFSAGAANYPLPQTPTVYCEGYGVSIYSAEGETLFPLSAPDGYIGEAVEACLPTLVEAFKTDEWDAYREQLFSYVLPIMGGLALDKNGEASNGSYRNFNDYNCGNRNYGGYAINAYVYTQEWRLDPFDNAAQLKRYIERVKSVTGSSKVNLVGRCQGANVVLAYLAEYGYDDVNCVQFLVQSAAGVDAIGAIFSGSLHIDADSVLRYFDQQENNTLGFSIDSMDPVLMEFINSTIKMLTETQSISALGIGIDAVLRKLYYNAVDDLLRETFATMPGVWSMVSSDYYQRAKRNIFKGYEEEYAGLIEKLDNYDVKVRKNMDNIFKEAQEHGVKFAVYAYYGREMVPLTYAYNELADSTVTLSRSSFGATTAKRAETLSNEYIANAKANGTDIYISPEKTVDCSTCLFRDTTWIVANSDHKNFNNIHAVMTAYISRDGQFTVFDDPNLPQFLYYDDSTGFIRPMRVEDSNVAQPDPIASKESIRDSVILFLRNLLSFLMKIFKGEFTLEL